MNTHNHIPVLACKDLTVGYKQKAVLRDLNLSFDAGQFVALLGPNGAGKTTLLRTLSRHLDPLGGRIEISGRPLAQLSAMELAKFMAVVLTEKVSPPLFCVFEFVALGRYPHTDFLGRMTPNDHQKVKSALEAVHAEHLSRRLFSDLSDGERQKVLVARALAQEPRLLLLDEPTIHLDLKHRMEVMAILRELCREKGITVIASLHDVDVASKVSDQVALVKDGAVSAWGSPEEVLQSRTVAKLYDFSSADYDNHLGSIELRGSGGNGRVFVVAGMGSGAMVFRLLTKKGFSMATGILPTNDLDYYVARSLGVDYIEHSPLEPVSGETLTRAERQMESCDVVVDCGFQTGFLNQANIELLQKALEKGKTVLSLRSRGLDRLFPDRREDNFITCNDMAHLLETLTSRFPTDGNSQPPSKMEKKAS